MHAQWRTNTSTHTKACTHTPMHAHTCTQTHTHQINASCAKKNKIHVCARTAWPRKLLISDKVMGTGICVDGMVGTGWPSHRSRHVRFTDKVVDVINPTDGLRPSVTLDVHLSGGWMGDGYHETIWGHGGRASDRACSLKHARTHTYTYMLLYTHIPRTHAHTVVINTQTGTHSHTQAHT